MAITRTSLLDLPIITTGTESGTWGDITNNGLTQYLDIAIAGMTSLTSANFTAGALTINTTEGDSSATNIAAGSAQYATIKVSSLAANSTITAPASNRSYRIVNADSTYSLTIKASGQTGVTFLPGQTGVVAFTGTDYEYVGVVNAASSTDNAIARFDSTTGNVLQNSGVTIDDSNNVSGVAQLNATTIDTTNIEVTNIKAKDGTASASIANSTGVFSHATTTVFPAGAVGTPAITTTGDTNTGIFFPAADTIAFAEGGAEAMRIDSSGNVGIGTSSPVSTQSGLDISSGGISLVVGANNTSSTRTNNTTKTSRIASYHYTNAEEPVAVLVTDSTATNNIVYMGGSTGSLNAATILSFYTAANNTTVAGSERMRIDSSGNVGIGTTSPESLSLHGALTVAGNSGAKLFLNSTGAPTRNFSILASTAGVSFDTASATALYLFYQNATERMRIDSSGNLLVGKTSLNFNFAGFQTTQSGNTDITRSGGYVLAINRLADDGDLVTFYQAGAQEGSISVSGNTVSYNAFAGSHWSQLQQGRGYNPDIPRGTVMSTIGEMCEWKSVEWTETTEHTAIPAVEAKEAVLDEEGNVIEPAVEAVKGKDAWTETSDKRETYLGDLPVGATFEEDGFTKTVVDDGNERLPKVKISDVVGDKAVYGVFQTWDEAQDMLVTSLGAFVVRIAAGVTVEIGDLLESNGDGCAKVQDDDVIRSKTIAKVTSTTPTATYDDGSYTVPAVIYCG
jgi:hypothetical protein